MPRDRIEGVVRTWDDEDGWGVVDAPELPGGCFVHHSTIVADGYRVLVAGEHVNLTFEQLRGKQDGYDYRALAVWRGDE